jgi:hypothetical protein
MKYRRQKHGVNKFKYLGITSETTGGRRNQKTLVQANGNQSLTTSDKCADTTGVTKVQTLEVYIYVYIYIYIYEKLWESKVMHGVELLELDKAWKETGRIHLRSCKKILGLPRCSANG